MKKRLIMLLFILVACGKTTKFTPLEVVTHQTHNIEAITKPQPKYSINDLSLDDLCIYFNEVVLDAEYVHGSGNPSVVQKWTSSINYYLFGDYTKRDAQVFTEFVDYINNIEGFPQMIKANDDSQANLRVYFTDKEGIVKIMGEEYRYNDGCVTFWYDNNEIYDCNICIDKNLDQYIKNSVILEELYNGLGPVQDTNLRSDSIIYEPYTTPQELSAIDDLILQLLYHPEMKCGMDLTQCREIIKSLYYEKK